MPHNLFSKNTSCVSRKGVLLPRELGNSMGVNRAFLFPLLVSDCWFLQWHVCGLPGVQIFVRLQSVHVQAYNLNEFIIYRYICPRNCYVWASNQLFAHKYLCWLWMTRYVGGVIYKSLIGRWNTLFVTHAYNKKADKWLPFWFEVILK